MPVLFDSDEAAAESPFAAGDTRGAALGSPPGRPAPAGLASPPPPRPTGPRKLSGGDAALYLHLHAPRFVRLAGERLAAIEPELPAGLRWNDQRRFVARFLDAFAARVGDLDPSRSGVIRSLLHPGDVFAAIDGGRLPGQRDWSDAAGRAFVHLVEAAYRQSLARMAGRYLAAARAKGRNGGDERDAWSPVAADELVLSHPMDALIAPGLPAYEVLLIEPGAAGDPMPARRKLDASRLEWQGGRDPRLWNWLRVADEGATAEDVAQALWGKSQNAYQIIAAPPYFGLPRAWARSILGRREADDGDADDEARAFAASALAGEAAQGAGEVLGPEALAERVEIMTAQLAHLEPLARRWGDPDAVVAARAFLAGHQGAAWSGALRTQEEVLYEATTAIAELDRQLPGIDPQAPEAAPYREVVAAYLRAAGTAHLATTSRAFLARARDLQRMLVGRVLADAARQAELNVWDMRGVTRDADPDRQRFTSASLGLSEDAARIQGELLAGKAPDAAEVDELLISAEELALKGRLRALDEKLGLVARAVHGANDSWLEQQANVFDDDIWDLPREISGLRARLGGLRAHLDEDVANERILLLGARDAPARLREARRAAVARARAGLAEVQKDRSVEDFLRSAYDEVEDAQVRALILQIGLLIGVSLVSAGLGSAATAAARGFLVARSAGSVAGLAGLSRGAMIATRVGGLALESSANTVGQVAITGKSAGRAFLEDFLGNLATSGLLHRLRSGHEAAEATEDAVRQMWPTSTGRTVLARGVELTGETLVGAATSYVMSRAVGSKPADLDPHMVNAWYLQGAAIAVGRFVHGAAGKQIARLDALGGASGWKLGRALGQEARALRSTAAQLEQRPSFDEGVALLRLRGDLLARERELLQQAAADPALAKQVGAALPGLRADADAAIAEHQGPGMARLAMESAGLRRVVGDRVWSGKPEDVDRAVEHAQKMGVPVRVIAATDDLQRLDIGGVAVEVQLRQKGRGLPSWPISKGSIVETPINERNMFGVSFDFIGPGGKVNLGHGSIFLRDGVPSDDPQFSLTATLTHQGQEYAVKIYDSVTTEAGSNVLQGQGQHTPLTEYALRSLLRRYRTRFFRDPPVLGGSLGSANLLNFQREYVLAKQYDPKLSEKQALDIAIRNISFGHHRINVGYSKFRVEADYYERVNLGDDLGFRRVPTAVQIEARKP